MKQGFRLGTIFAAIGAMFRSREVQRVFPQAEQTHDDYSHARHKRQLHSRAFIRKYRRARNARNEMAFQSRKRNR